MNTTEELLRDALSATANTIEPDTLTPLRAPDRRRSPTRWATPLASAGALLVLVVVVVIGGRMHDSQPQPALSGGSGPSRIVTVTDGAAVVRDASGRKTADVPAVRGSYVAVSADRDGRTFFLAAAEGRCAVSVYRLTFRADGLVNAPQRVSKSIRVSEDDTALAVSPDGTRLAVTGACESTYQVSVVDTRSGEVRTWTAPTTARMRFPASWSTDGRTLTVFWWDVRRDVEKAPILLLDPQKPLNGDLSKAPVLRLAGIHEGRLEGGRIEAFAYNPDGRTMTAVVSLDNYRSAVTRLSATTGQLIGEPTPIPNFAIRVVPDATGRRLLLAGDGRVARMDGDQLKWIKVGENFTDAAW